MELRPILSTLRRHKTTAALLILEIALTCAIVCNAVFMIGHRLQHMRMSTGIDEHALVQVQLAEIAPTPDIYARAREDLAVLKQVPGVQAVALTNQLPLQGSSSNASIKLDPAQRAPTLSVGTYFGEDIPQTMGTRLVAGRNLRPDETTNADLVVKALASGNTKGLPAVTVITQELAQRLWPGQNPLGKSIYVTDQVSVRVVGVLADLVRANAYNDATAHYSVVLPLFMGAGKDQSYVIRTRPQDRATVLKVAVAALKKADPERVVTTQRSYDELRQKFFANDRAMAGVLVGVILALLTVTALGIVGLASFWVAQRRRTIGVRRALGATRADILRYFQTENFLLASIGIALGMLLAYGINLFLMLHYELPRLPAIYFPIGAVTLWLIGQVAVLGPALRAAAVPPVVATRSV
ncbi:MULTISPECIES: ABC transporter permease [Rhodanobacter]|uniref:ABC transporter permease n=1 Tax=Rhodanobacter TaxID=75309 RepID=UPI000260C7DE|nr:MULTISPECIES: FtsX-like permease family protein [Rhodanobacter]EIM04768.1 antimicrobial peptide ABC transporter permease [Rhodanobacter denitrificans]KZC21304.1 ABC transporter permease [Rhodanobacter denitrificans]UJJ51877.1 FtsX-like permease family protein [Rhodanobacter denitrificans]UJM89810.1 FtsX-like permease family protein [Rhodanobacter denitrificans]UJM94621.1 FtsX-like permease family protein [Rhodanobacter denitrificans]